jgi:hypothetical protein
VCNPVTFIRCHAALCTGVDACLETGCNTLRGWPRLRCKLAATRIIFNYCPSTVIGGAIQDILGL